MNYCRKFLNQNAKPLNQHLRRDLANPFISHAFLSALEESGSATKRTGWAGAHVLVEDKDGELLACAPAYLKAIRRASTSSTMAGPMPMSAPAASIIPSSRSPCPSRPRPAGGCWCGPAPRADEARDALVRRAEGPAQAGRRVLHPRHLPAQGRSGTISGTQGFLQRTDQQFHWFNEGYGSFDDFLAALASRKRKAMKRERRDALANGITIEQADRQGHHRGALGRLLRVLHGHRLAQMGPALPDAHLLLADRRAHGRPASC